MCLILDGNAGAVIVIVRVCRVVLDDAGGMCQSINAYEIEMQCHNYYVLQTTKDE